MKKTDYDLPIFEDKDIGDLNYYSEEMAKAIKIQIDKFGNPLIFKGTVETLEELQKLTNVKNGEIYRVKTEKKNYIYDGENWTIYSDNTDSDFDELKAKTIKCLQEVETPTPVSGTSIDLNDSADAKITDLKISGNSKQEKREGYNILPYPYSNDTKTSNGITWTINNDGSIKVSGTSTGTSFIDLYNNGLKMIISKDEKYTFAVIKKDGTFGFALHHYNYINGWSDIRVGTNIINITGSSSSTGDLFRLVVEGSGKTVNETIYPILVKGSYTANTLPKYEPYGAMPSPDYPSEVECCGDNGSINEVICNKNLFNTDVEQGSVSTDTGEKISSEYSIRTEFIRVTPNKEYILKYSTDLTSDYNTKIVEFDKNKAFLKTTVALSPSKELSITTNNQTEYVIIAIYSGTKLTPLTYTNYFKNIEFKQNDGSEYIEHKKQVYAIPTQQPFRAIGDIRDTFIKKNNKWYERHYIGRFTLNSSVSYNKYGSSSVNAYYTRISYFTNQEPVYPENNNMIAPIVCTHALSTYINDIAYNGAKKVGFSHSSTKEVWIGFGSSGPATIEEFKTWLQEQYNAGTPVYVDYLLEEPLDIECTEEQSTILWDIEQNAKTYDKVTHMYSTDKISSYKEVTYKKDIETLFNNTLVESGV